MIQDCKTIGSLRINYLGEFTKDVIEEFYFIDINIMDFSMTKVFPDILLYLKDSNLYYLFIANENKYKVYSSVYFDDIRYLFELHKMSNK